MHRSRISIAVALMCLGAFRTVAAQAVPTVAQQITGAVLALPEPMRAGAGVMGYKTPGKLESLRASTNGMICLANDPAGKGFHVSCYHESMEPFMARGRALRATGVKGAQVDTARFAEVKSGKLKMPTAPASLYQIFADAYDPATGKLTNANGLFVVYVPFATEKSTGLSTQSSETQPWLMLPGTPKAHIMFSTKM